MQPSVPKHSLVVNGHITSISLEDQFWTALKEIATSRDKTVSELVSIIDAGRHSSNLSSAVRLFILDYYRRLAAPGAVPETERFSSEFSIMK
jgi:predicted DNA-binding ribbon-helix-helix protein